MLIYIIAVTSAVVISAVLMLLIFNRLKLLNFWTLLSITLASLIAAIAIPVIFYIASASKNGSVQINKLLLATVTTIAVYVMLAFILSLIISHILPRIAAKRKTSEPQILDAMLEGAGTTGGNYLEQIFDNFTHENESETSNNAENMNEVENNLEISVDSTENIDKMGIENKVQESENLTIAECIEEAFRYKEQNDAEGAILHYMYALDKKPDNELAFWIVLDICVMYKALGQYELALDILNSYNDSFGNIMDASVREEIESNLNNILTDNMVL